MPSTNWVISVTEPNLGATIGHLTTAPPEAPIPREIEAPWIDYGRYAAVAAERFGIVQASGREPFKSAFANAWLEAAAALARPPTQVELPGLDASSTARILIMTWNCPESLRLLPLAPRIGAQVLMCNDAEWFTYLRNAGCLLITTAQDAGARMREALSAGRPLAYMADHLQPDARAVVMAPLFGHAVPTDIGVLRAARDAGYRLLFAASRDGAMRIVEAVDLHGFSAAVLTTRVNALIEQEIRSAPTRWLLWPALPSRVILPSMRTIT